MKGLAEVGGTKSTHHTELTSMGEITMGRPKIRSFERVFALLDGLVRERGGDLVHFPLSKGRPRTGATTDEVLSNMYGSGLLFHPRRHHLTFQVLLAMADQLPDNGFSIQRDGVQIGRVPDLKILLLPREITPRFDRGDGVTGDVSHTFKTRGRGA